MQWLLMNQDLLVTILLSSAMTAIAVGWLIQRTMVFRYQLLKQQAEAERRLLMSQVDALMVSQQQAQQDLDVLDIERDKSALALKQSHGELMAAKEKLRYFDTVQQERQQFAQRLEQTKDELAQVRSDLREQRVHQQEERRANQEKIALLEGAEERLKQAFEQLANQLFEQKSAKVDEQNRQSLDSLLSPLKEQLEGFKKQVTDSFGMEAKERHTLVHEIKNLQRLNEQMTQEALNLTQALKGDNKQQGNWGEVVLARVLAESGLREGHEYQTQVSLQDESGKRYQPDVIVHLPHHKSVVIDAKMALVAYERFFNAESEQIKSQALSDHLAALRAHIKGLSVKEYQQLKGIQSLDYVLMFIPVEPAFQLAMEADPSLVRDAMAHNIIIVSPTTLLVALRTIDNLWRNDRQNQNAQLIAERASKLYDKLRLFVDDMTQVGVALDKANLSYQGAMNKLSTGRGNMIRQAEGFKALGVDIKRPISPSLTEIAENDSSTERHL